MSAAARWHAAQRGYQHGCGAHNSSSSSLLHPPPANWSVALAVHLEADLQDKYSTRLYGGPIRAPLDTLKVLWLELATDRMLTIIAKLGVCSFHTRCALLPFYSPSLIGSRIDLSDAITAQLGDPADTIWIGRNMPRARDLPAISHSWVEVMHCGSSLPRASAAARSATSMQVSGGWRRATGPAWMYHAPGSGVSINVGNTLVLEFAAAIELLSSLFNTTRSACEASGRGVWHGMRARGGEGSTATAGQLQPSSSYAPALPSEIDTIQIIGHKEHYSAERKHGTTSDPAACTLPRGHPATWTPYHVTPFTWTLRSLNSCLCA